jgi:hypothetical protein
MQMNKDEKRELRRKRLMENKAIKQLFEMDITKGD